MATFASIAGFVVEIQHDGAQEDEKEYIGDSGRAADGTLGSLVRAEKRNWTLKSGPMLESVFQDISAAIALDQYVPVTGDFLGGIGLTCVVRILSAAYIPDGTVDGFYRIPVFKIRQA